MPHMYNYIDKEPKSQGGDNCGQRCRYLGEPAAYCVGGSVSKVPETVAVVTEITEDAVYLLGSEYDPVNPKLTRFVRYRLVRENDNIKAEWIDRDTEEYTYESKALLWLSWK